MQDIESELDAIFNEIVTITEAPKLPKKSHLKTGTKTCLKVSIIIYLSEPSDQKDIFEITNLKYIDNRSSCITVKGLSEALEVGSWIKRSELPYLIRLNKDIRFVIGGE